MIRRRLQHGAEVLARGGVIAALVAAGVRDGSGRGAQRGIGLVGLDDVREGTHRFVGAAALLPAERGVVGVREAARAGQRGERGEAGGALGVAAGGARIIGRACCTSSSMRQLGRQLRRQRVGRRRQHAVDGSREAGAPQPGLDGRIEQAGETDVGAARRRACQRPRDVAAAHRADDARIRRVEADDRVRRRRAPPRRATASPSPARRWRRARRRAAPSAGQPGVERGRRGGERASRSASPTARASARSRRRNRGASNRRRAGRCRNRTIGPPVGSSTAACEAPAVGLR